MDRYIAAALVTLTCTVSSVSAQGILQRAGNGLDNLGRGIRNAVDGEVVRQQINAEDREVLNRVMRRLEWDAPLVGSSIQFEVRPGRVVVLRGSVLGPVHKQRAAALVASTLGVASVVDELAVVKEVKVIQGTPTVQVFDVTPPVTTGTTVIVKP
jgi:hyperosmotically inducible protein